MEWFIHICAFLVFVIVVCLLHQAYKDLQKYRKPTIAEFEEWLNEYASTVADVETISHEDTMESMNCSENLVTYLKNKRKKSEIKFTHSHSEHEQNSSDLPKQNQSTNNSSELPDDSSDDRTIYCDDSDVSSVSTRSDVTIKKEDIPTWYELSSKELAYEICHACNNLLVSTCTVPCEHCYCCLECADTLLQLYNRCPKCHDRIDGFRSIK